MLGHVLTGGPVPVAFEWLIAVMLFGGAAGAVLLHRRPWRLVAAVIACVGFVATVGSWVLAALQPGAPPYTIRIVAPVNGARVSSPVVLTVCGVRADKSLLPSTDGRHYLAVFIDSREVPTVDTWHVAERLTAGVHTIRVELVTPSHHAFTPAMNAQVRLTADARAGVVGPGRC